LISSIRNEYSSTPLCTALRNFNFNFNLSTPQLDFLFSNLSVAVFFFGGKLGEDKIMKKENKLKIYKIKNLWGRFSI